MKKTMLILVMMITVISIFAVTNTWDGSSNYSWGTSSNWSLNHVPVTSEDVIIPSSSNYTYYPSITSMNAVCRYLTVESGGQLRLSSNGTLTVTYDVTIYGKLGMVNTGCELTVNDDIFWKNGSTENLQSGTIYVNDDWTFENGTNCTPTSGNTVVFDGSGSQIIKVQDSNSYFANVIIDNSASVIWLSNSSTYDIHVNNDLTLTNNSRLQVETNTLTVDETLDIETGSKIYLEDVGGEMILNSDFTLNGELDIDGGDALIHGDFDLAGILTIDGGSFIGDRANNNHHNYIWGNFNISNGLFELTNNTIYFTSTSDGNITGGIIRTGGNFIADSDGFQANGGVVEMTSTLIPHIYVDSSSYFYDLYLQSSAVQNHDALTIQNDLIIFSGILNFNNYTVNVGNNVEIFTKMSIAEPAEILNIGNDIIWHSGSDDYNLTNGTINISGDWYFNDGTNAQLGTGNTVNFNGSTTQNIYCYDADAAFGNVGVNKTGGNLNIHTSSTQPMRVDGDLDAEDVNSFNIQSGELIVDGTLDIHSSSEMTLGINGSLTNNSDFTLDGELDVGTSGDALIHGEFDLASTGTLTIDGGSFVYDEGVSAPPLNIRGSFNMSDGFYSAPEYFGIDSSVITNVTGGTIKVIAFIAEYTNTFQPTGGSVEIQTDNGGSGIIKCSNGNFFHNLSINPVFNNGLEGAILYTDIIIHDNLEIAAGNFVFNGNEVIVYDDVIMDGGLKMVNSSDVLSVGDDIIFNTGSFSNSNDIISSGTIYVSGDWYFNDGTDAQLGTGNTVNFNGSTTQNIYCNDADAAFGNVTIDQSGYPIYAVWLAGSSTYDIQVSGDFTLEPDNIFQVSTEMLTIDGTLDIKNNGKLYLEHTGGELVNNSDFTLNGELDIDGGDALIHGEFDLASTGILTIDGGSLIEDDPDLHICNIWGTFNMSDGIFQTIEGKIRFENSATSNITGGLVKGESFEAIYSGTFLPTGGTVEINATNGSYGFTNCTSGNFFYNLKVNPSAGIGCYLENDTMIQNDLEVTSGVLKLADDCEVTVNNNMDILGILEIDTASEKINVRNNLTWFSGSNDDITDGTINVSGDWYFNDGTDAQLGTGNTVNFVGAENSSLYCNDADACFGNLIVDKDTSGYRLEILETARVSGDLDISNGYLLMGDLARLEIGNELNINNGGTLSTNANDDAPVITKYGTDPYAFNVESGGIISSFSTLFEYMDANGVNVKPGAIISTGSLFWDCIFRNGTSGGTLLTIDNDQVVTLDNVWFYGGSRDAAYNVTKNVDAGEITFTSSGGSFDGPDYEYDPYNRLHWSGFSAPTVITNAITEIAQTTATGGGNITANGGSSISARGVCWSTISNPTLADDFTEDSTGTGTFVSSLTTLDSDTFYHVRAYATNSVGTAYGNEVTFTTLSVVAPDAPANISITISDGNVVLTWDAVTGADSYNVYSSDDPHKEAALWDIKQSGITGTSWNETIPGDKLFYYVTANSGTKIAKKTIK